MTKVKKRKTRKAPAVDWAALTFQGIQPSNPEAFNHEWDSQRGFFARVTAELLQLDDKAMEAKVSASPAAANTFMDMYDSIVGEIEYLRLHIKMLNSLTVRMLAVAHRVPPSVRDAPIPQAPRLAAANGLRVKGGQS